MGHRSSFATVNDFLHAVVIFGVFAVSAIGLSGELFSFRSETALSIATNSIAEASIAIGTPFVQPRRKTDVE